MCLQPGPAQPRPSRPLPFPVTYSKATLADIVEQLQEKESTVPPSAAAAAAPATLATVSARLLAWPSQQCGAEGAAGRAGATCSGLSGLGWRISQWALAMDLHQVTQLDLSPNPGCW